MKERFKISIKDRLTGYKQTYYVHSLGFYLKAKVKDGKIEMLKVALENPRKKACK